MPYNYSGLAFCIVQNTMAYLCTSACSWIVNHPYVCGINFVMRPISSWHFFCSVRNILYWDEFMACRNFSIWQGELESVSCVETGLWAIFFDVSSNVVCHAANLVFSDSPGDVFAVDWRWKARICRRFRRCALGPSAQRVRDNVSFKALRVWLRLWMQICSIGELPISCRRIATTGWQSSLLKKPKFSLYLFKCYVISMLL